MFPPTDSAKSAFDLFPTTDNVKDINPPRSLHVECCVVLYHDEYKDQKTGKEMKVEVTAEL